MVENRWVEVVEGRWKGSGCLVLLLSINPYTTSLIKYLASAPASASASASASTAAAAAAAATAACLAHHVEIWMRSKNLPCGR